MKKLSLLCLLLFLTGCSNKEVIKNANLLESSDSEIPKIVSSTMENINVGREIDILKETLPNNDSGVENPQHQFYEIFGEKDENLEPPEGYLTMDMTVDEEERINVLKEELGDDLGVRFYHAFTNYTNAEVLTDEIYQEFKSVLLESDGEYKEYSEYFYYADFDRDGLSDYNEIEVYGSDPNRKSTSGDFYEDGYKVEHGMDLFTVHEVDWIELDDKFQILGYDSNSCSLSKCYSYNPYLDNNLVEFLTISYNFNGKIRYKSSIDGDVSNLLVAVYNPNIGSLDCSVIDSKVVDDYLEFEVDLGYCNYLVFDKSIDINKFLEPHRY